MTLATLFIRMLKLPERVTGEAVERRHSDLGVKISK